MLQLSDALSDTHRGGLACTRLAAAGRPLGLDTIFCVLSFAVSIGGSTLVPSHAGGRCCRVDVITRLLLRPTFLLLTLLNPAPRPPYLRTSSHRQIINNLFRSFSLREQIICCTEGDSPKPSSPAGSFRFKDRGLVA